MLVLDDARIRNVVIGIVDDRIALVIVGIELFRFKPQRAVLELAEFIVEISVDCARIDDGIRERVELGCVL